MSPGRSNFIVNLAVFILLEVAALCMICSGGGTRQVWLGGFFTGIQGWINGVAESWTEYLSLREDNRRLAEENLILFEKLRSETGRNSMPDPESGPALILSREHFCYMMATIVTMSRGSQHNYLILDKGRDDGVSENDGVISSKGVVGLVTRTSSHFSYVTSVLNQGMILSVRVGMNGEVGTLQWDGHSGRSSKMADIPLYSQLNAGDTVYTSGFSPFYPGDIPLGTIQSSTIDRGSSRSASVTMFEDFHALRYVTIVKNLDREEIENLETSTKSSTEKK